MTSRHELATAKANKAANVATNVANVIAPRRSRRIGLLSPLTDSCTTDVYLLMIMLSLKNKKGGQVTESASFALGLATLQTTATSLRKSNNSPALRRKTNRRHRDSCRISGKQILPNLSLVQQPKCAATTSGVSTAMPTSTLRLIATASLPIVSSIVQSKLRDGMGLWIPLLVLDLSTLLAKVDADFVCPMSTMLLRLASSC